LLAGVKVDGESAVNGDTPPTRDLAGRLSAQVRSVVVTEGARRVHVGSATDGITHIDAVSDTRAVDTTGAVTSPPEHSPLRSASEPLQEAFVLANAAAGHIVTLPRGRR
jgi:hypothetical protein